MPYGHHTTEEVDGTERSKRGGGGAGITVTYQARASAQANPHNAECVLIDFKSNIMGNFGYLLIGRVQRAASGIKRRMGRPLSTKWLWRYVYMYVCV